MESYEKAVKHVSTVLKDDPQVTLFILLEEASQMFDLNPEETSRLYNLYKNKEGNGS
jgi:hypothetical protein